MPRALFFAFLWTAALGCQSAPSAPHPARAEKPFLVDTYLDLIRTYVVYSQSIWHDDPAGAGGFWGDGIDAKNQNGAVRGMCNTLLGHAMLVHALDNGWIAQSSVPTREELLRYIRANLSHLVAHHKSTPDALQPTWGFHWQSPLWLGAAGPAVLLVHDDLSTELLDGFNRLVAAEADRVANKPPKDYLPGDTGAEENAWDTHAPAVALALMPHHPHAEHWFDALKRYAVNVYSVPSDRTSAAMVGRDRVRELVTTANLFNDYTLENHKIFHPDYVQVSGQHLGEALMILTLGDRRNGTHLADECRPYAMHHVRDVWEHVMRPLLMPDGEWAFPNGTDWTFHCSMTPAYLAFIATAFGDDGARAGQAAQIQHALRRRSRSSPGRILGDSNLEWWWEPLLVKRMCTAMLIESTLTSRSAVGLQLDGTGEASLAPTKTKTHLWPDAKVWTFRNTDYFLSLAWGNKQMASFTPQQQRFVTLPADGVLPKEVTGFIGDEQAGDARVASLSLKDGGRVVVVCLPHSVLFLSPVPLRSLPIENDPVSGGERVIYNSAESPVLVRALEKHESFDLAGNWANVSDSLGLITTAAAGFRYTPAGGYTQKSVAADRIVPLAKAGAWQIIPRVDHQQTQQLAGVCSASVDGDTTIVFLKDGPADNLYRVRAPLRGDGPIDVITTW